MPTKTKPEPVQKSTDEGFVSPTREPELASDVDLAAEAERIFADDLVDPDERQADIEAAFLINGPEDIRPGEWVDEPRVPPRARRSLHAKLADLRANFGFIGKTGTNKGVGGGYQFVEAKEVGRRFVQMASERGLTMLPIEMQLEQPRQSASGKQMVDTLLVTWRVTDVDTDEFIDIPSYGQGADSADKSLPKAQTNAMKYAILLLLQAAGDDPENDPATDKIENTQETPGINISGSDIAGVRQGGRQNKTTQPQMDAIKAHARRLELSPESLAVIIGTALGGKAPELDDKEKEHEQQRAVLAFLGELDFAETGEVIQFLEGVPDAYDEAMAPENVGAK